MNSGARRPGSHHLPRSSLTYNICDLMATRRIGLVAALILGMFAAGRAQQGVGALQGL